MYDDHRKKSRTQLLREKLAALEAKLAELEGSPQANLEASSSENGSTGDPWSPFTAELPFDGASPSTSSWPLPEPQTWEPTTAVTAPPSSLHWPDPIASTHWEMGSAYPDSNSDISPLRQTTPVSNVNISVETQQFL